MVQAVRIRVMCWAIDAQLHLLNVVGICWNVGSRARLRICNVSCDFWQDGLARRLMLEHDAIRR
jgi:hypothetical protein